MNSFLNGKYRMLLISILAGIVLRFLMLADFSVLPLTEFPAGPDITEYLNRAQSILCGAFLSSEVEIHAPLYPFFLAGLLSFCKNLWCVRLLQSILCLLLTVIPFWLMLKKRFSLLSGTKCFLPGIAALILSLYPPLIVYQLDFFSESLMIAFCAWSLFFLSVRPRQSFCSGIFGGLAVLTHPLCVFYLPAAAGYLFFHYGKNLPRRRAILLFTAGAALMILPFCVRNSVIAGHPAFVQGNGGFNFYLGNNPSATGTCRIAPGIEWEKIHAYAASRAKAEGITQDQFFFRESWKFLKTEPVHFLKNLGRKALLSLHVRELTTWSDVSVLQLTWSHRFGYHFYFGLLLIAGLPVLVAGIFRKSLRDSMGPFFLLFLAVWFGQIITVTAGRYRLILILPLSACSAYFLCSFREFFRNRKAVCCTLLSAGAGLTALFFPAETDPHKESCYAKSLLASSWLKASCPEMVLKIYPEYDRKDSFHYRRLNLMGEAAVQLKQPLSAMHCFETAIRDYPEMPEGYLNAGTLYLDAHQMKQARELFDRAGHLIRDEQARTLWEYNYGRMEQLSGDFPAAKRHYENVMRLNPAHDRTLNNYGTLLIQEKKPADAVPFFRRALRLRSHDSRLRLNLALALALSGAKEEAQAELRRILASEPDNPSAVSFLQKLKEEK